MIEYAYDHDDRLPLRDRWVDDLAHYETHTETYRCPKIGAGGYGYAFDARLEKANVEKLPDPAGSPMLYDSVNPIRNASDPFASLPTIPRHRFGQNFVGYADGHVKGVKPPVVQ